MCDILQAGYTIAVRQVSLGTNMRAGSGCRVMLDGTEAGDHTCTEQCQAEWASWLVAKWYNELGT
jgi:hypothetical protein